MTLNIKTAPSVLGDAIRNFITTSIFAGAVSPDVITPLFLSSFLSTFLDTFDEKLAPESIRFLNRKLAGFIAVDACLFSSYDRSPKILLDVLVSYANTVIFSEKMVYYLTADFDISSVLAEKSEKDAWFEIERKVHEHAWFEIATRIAGAEPPFVPLNGDSKNLSDTDCRKLKEFFLKKHTLTWVTGIGSLDACDSMVAEAQMNGNFRAAYSYQKQRRNGELSKKELTQAERQLVSFHRTFDVLGTLKSVKTISGLDFIPVA